MVDKTAGFRFEPLLLLLALAGGGASLYLLASEHAGYALLPAAAILLMLTFTHWNRWAYYVFVFMIPFEFLSRLSEGSRAFTAAKLVGAWITVVVLFSLLLDRTRVGALRTRLWLPICLFCVANFLAALFSPYPLTAADNLRKLAVAVTVFALTLFFVDRRGFRRSLPETMIWSVVINYVLFIAVFLFKLPLSIGGEPLYGEKPGDQSYDFQGITSAYFVFLLPLLVHRAFFSTSVVKKNLYAFLTLLAVSGVVYFGSRAVAVTFVAVAILLFIQYLRHIKPKMVGFFLAFLCVAAALVLAFVPARYWDRMKSVTETKTDTSIGRRVTYLEVSWEAFKARPFFGAGPGTFPDIYSQTLQAASFAGESRDLRRKAHNTYLEVLVGSGLVGLATFLGILAVAVGNYRRAVAALHARGRNEDEFLVSAYLTMFVAHIFFILFTSLTYDKLIWILLAMSQVSLLCAAAGSADGGDAVAPRS